MLNNCKILVPVLRDACCLTGNVTVLCDHSQEQHDLLSAKGRWETETDPYTHNSSAYMYQKEAC